MPNINFATVPDMKPFSKWEYRTIPEGWYLAEICDVKPEFQPSGVEVWVIHWVVVEGPEKGVGMKDWMHWGDEDDGPKSESALSRCKLICKVIGIDVSKPGEVNLQPKNILGGTAWIKTYQRSSADGKKIYNNVSLDGLRAATQAELDKAHGQEQPAEVPF